MMDDDGAEVSVGYGAAGLANGIPLAISIIAVRVHVDEELGIAFLLIGRAIVTDVMTRAWTAEVRLQVTVG